MSGQIEYSWEAQLLRAVASPHTGRRDVAETYRHAKDSGEDVEWERVHQAIVARWSHFAVEWIRREASRDAAAINADAEGKE
jgi:hypothetical protein